MTITQEISSDQMRGLNLHQGDSLRVIAEKGPTMLIQIVRAAIRPEKPKVGSAGAWARQYAGAAKPSATESTDDARMSHYQEKYGL